MYITNNASIQDVLLFPQIWSKEKKAQIELYNEEKTIVILLIGNENKMDLAQLKVTSALSGEKWDA